MKIWRHEFQVRGTTRFPVDMLRYDWCFPLHEHEVHEIENSIISAGADTPLAITLVHYDSSQKWAPTVGRWQSFGWQVHQVKRERREW